MAFIRICNVKKRKIVRREFSEKASLGFYDTRGVN